MARPPGELTWLGSTSRLVSGPVTSTMEPSMKLDTKMRSSASSARLSRPTPGRPTTSRSPLSRSMRTTSPRIVSSTCNRPWESNFTAAGIPKSVATISASPLSTSTRATSALNQRGPYSLSSGPQSMPLRPQPGPSSSLIRRGSSTPFGSISNRCVPRKHCEMNSLPSSENVMGFAPGPGAPTMLVTPSGVRLPTSPPAMSVQYIAPSASKVRSSGPLTPSSGP